MDNPVNSSTSVPGGSSQVLAAIYWLVVGLPLAWGVYQTVQKSIPLFHVTSAPTAMTAVPTATVAPADAATSAATPAPEATVAPLATATPIGTVGPILTPAPTP